MNVPARGNVPRAETIYRSVCTLLRQREHRERSAERGAVAKGRIAAHCAEARGRIGQPGRKADTRPAADA